MDEPKITIEMTLKQYDQQRMALEESKERISYRAMFDALLLDPIRAELQDANVNTYFGILREAQNEPFNAKIIDLGNGEYEITLKKKVKI